MSDQPYTSPLYIFGAESLEAIWQHTFFFHNYSFLFDCIGIGLSNTLGAFLAGLLLAETKYKYQIEADIAPFRGLLLGFFFTTVGFNIDLGTSSFISMWRNYKSREILC